MVLPGRKPVHPGRAPVSGALPRRGGPERARRLAGVLAVAGYLVDLIGLIALASHRVVARGLMAAVVARPRHRIGRRRSRDAGQHPETHHPGTHDRRHRPPPRRHTIALPKLPQPDSGRMAFPASAVQLRHPQSSSLDVMHRHVETYSPERVERILWCVRSSLPPTSWEPRGDGQDGPAGQGRRHIDPNLTPSSRLVIYVAYGTECVW